MNFSVIRLFGKQHLVTQGQTITVNATINEKELIIPEVLLQSIGGDLKIGTPLVDKAEVKAQVVKTGKGQKLHIFKFKAKSRYRRKMGFRPQQTQLKILDFNGKVPVVSKPDVKKKKPTAKKTTPQKAI